MNHEERQALIRKMLPPVRVVAPHTGHAGVTFDSARVDGPHDLDEHDYFSRAVYSSLDRDDQRETDFMRLHQHIRNHISGCR